MAASPPTQAEQGEKMKWSLLPILTIGCGVTELEEKESDSATEPVVESDGISPIIIEADAWCYILEETEKWAFSAVVEDPQGSDNIKRFMTDAVEFQDLGGGIIGSSAIACEGGDCTGTASSSSINLGCTTPENFNAKFTIEDEDGNISEPKTVNCRRGNGVGG